jgi:surfeit locus 1 family protein
MSQTKISKAGIAFFSSLCASTFALGSWQTQRYFEKVDLMDRRETDLRKEPIPYEKHRQDPESFRRIKLHGSFDHDREIYIGPRGPPAGALALSGPNSGRGGGLSSSPQGYFVITPFVLSSDSNTTILVNRGWVPRNFVLPPPSQQVTLVDTWDRPHGIVDIVGVSSRAEGECMNGI